MIDTNPTAAQCPLVTLETIHTLFITAGPFILSNNVYLNTFTLLKLCHRSLWKRLGLDEAGKELHSPGAFPTPQLTMTRFPLEVQPLPKLNAMNSEGVK